MRYSKYLTLPLASLALASTGAQAELNWQNFSVTYLYGTNYQFTPNGEMEVVTFEHASSHNWGDTFMFIDRKMPDEGKADFYGEFAPRLSLSYLSGSELSLGPVRDLFLASMWEMGEGFDNFGAGIGTAWTIPGFRYVNLNLYYMDNETSDNEWLFNGSWALPLELASQKFLYDGFIDWSNRTDTNLAEFNWTSQLKWDVGANFGLKSPLYLGAEFAYWNNKYGTNINERVASALVKWHF